MDRGGNSHVSPSLPRSVDRPASSYSRVRNECWSPSSNTQRFPVLTLTSFILAISHLFLGWCCVVWLCECVDMHRSRCLLFLFSLSLSLLLPLPLPLSLQFGSSLRRCICQHQEGNSQTNREAGQFSVVVMPHNPKALFSVVCKNCDSISLILRSFQVQTHKGVLCCFEKNRRNTKATLTCAWAYGTGVVWHFLMGRGVLSLSLGAWDWNELAWASQARRGLSARGRVARHTHATHAHVGRYVWASSTECNHLCQIMGRQLSCFVLFTRSDDGVSNFVWLVFEHFDEINAKSAF